MMTTKICNDCGQEKGIEEFTTHYGFKDGRNSKCRECVKKRYKKYYQNKTKKLIKPDPMKSTRYCVKCDTRKPSSAFAGTHTYCLECTEAGKELFTEAPKCCGKVVSMGSLTSSGHTHHKLPDIWFCVKCRQQVGVVDDQLTPEKMLKAMYNPSGERWDTVKSN